MSDAIVGIADPRTLLAAREAELAAAGRELTGARLRIAQDQAQLAKMRHMRFDRLSETLDSEIRQLGPLHEHLKEGAAAQIVPMRLSNAGPGERRHSRRRPLPVLATFRQSNRMIA